MKDKLQVFVIVPKHRMPYVAYKNRCLVGHNHYAEMARYEGKRDE